MAGTGRDFVVNILGDTAGVEKAFDAFEKHAATAAVAAAAAFAGAKIGEAMTANLEADSANRVLAASLGATPEEAARYGEAAAIAFRGGWGESQSEISASIADVLSGLSELEGASAETLADATARATDLARVFEMDVAGVANTAGLMVRNGLARDWSDAFDLMTASMQQVPAALRGEVQDATNEYSQFFAQLGLDGPEAMGLLVSASQMGQYAIDKTGDSIKELTIRGTDMSKATQEAYAAAGLSTEEMTGKLLAGGEHGQQALVAIANGLLGIEDPGVRASAAIALFGTPIEDLGTDKIPAFLTSLASVNTGLGDVAGASAAMSEQLQGPEARVESLRRSMDGWVQDLVNVPGPLGEVALYTSAFGGDAMQVVSSLGMMIIALQGMRIGQMLGAVATGVATAAQWAWNVAMGANPIGLVILAIAALIAIIWLLVANWDSVSEAGTRAWEWIQSAWSNAGEWFTGIGQSIRDTFAGAFNSVASLWNSTIGSLQWTLPSWVPGIGGSTLGVPQIPMLASGGTVTGRGLALVGERGPELLDLPVGASVVPLGGSTAAEALAAAGSPGQGTTVNIVNHYPQAEPTSVTTNRALDHAAALGVA